MASTALTIKAVVVDCEDPERVAAFWAALLGRPVAARTGPYVWLSPDPAAPVVGFQRAAGPKQGKNRVHLDLVAAEPAAEQARIEALGGRRLPGYEEGGFLVMADPEGNEFCIIPPEPLDIGDDGRAHYLDGS